MVRFVSAFILSTTFTYVVLATVFALYCVLGGHNLIEMLYGSSASIFLSLAAGLELAFRTGDPKKARRG